MIVVLTLTGQREKSLSFRLSFVSFFFLPVPVNVDRILCLMSFVYQCCCLATCHYFKLIFDLWILLSPSSSTKCLRRLICGILILIDKKYVQENRIQFHD